MADAVFGPDFLNTHPVLNGRPAELIPDFDALLRWLRAAKLIRSRDVARLRRRWAESAWARQTAEGMREHKLMGYHHGTLEDREFRNLCHLDGVVRRQPCSITMVAALAYIQQMRDAIAPKPRGFTAIGVFLFFGAVMATFAATTLLRRGTPLDRLWALNPSAYKQLAPLGSAVGVLFLLLSATLTTAGLGWFQRRLWGWRLNIAS